MTNAPRATLVLALCCALGCQSTPVGQAATPCTRFEAFRTRTQEIAPSDELDLVLFHDPTAADRVDVDHAIAEVTGLLLGGRLAPGAPREFRPLTDVRTTVLSARLSDAAARASDLERAGRELASDESGASRRNLAVVLLGPCEPGEASGLAERLVSTGRWWDLSAVCVAEPRSALATMLTEIARARCPFGCLFESLPLAWDGRVDCELLERLAPGASSSECDRLPGRSLAEVRTSVDEGEITICRIAQIDLRQSERGEPGWYYDRSNTGERLCGNDAGRFMVTPNAAPLVGSEIALSCLERASTSTSDLMCSIYSSGSRQDCTVGMRCDSGEAGNACDDRAAPDDAPLRCDAISERCAYACESDDDCELAGLAGHVCDLRTLEEAAGSLADRVSAPRQRELRRVCVSPTCG